MDSKKRNKDLNEWRKTHTRRITILLNNNTDKDILDRLDSVGNKQGHIKGLVRKDLQARC